MFEFIDYTLLLAWPAVTLVRLLMAGRGRRLSILQSWWMLRTWKRTARMIGLTVTDKKRRRDGRVEKREYRPRLHVRTDRYGVIAHTRTLPGIGPEEWNKAASHLADAWRCCRVSVEHPKPGRVTVRAVREDPLTTAVDYRHNAFAPASLDQVRIGVDEYARDVALRLKQASGLLACGVPGSGKTSLFLTLLCSLAPSPAVQFVVADGKVSHGTDGDWCDVEPRCAAVVGDDLAEFNTLAKQLDELRVWRSSNIRRALGRKSIWDGGGPTPDWPLVVVFVDEAHTYFEAPKGNDDKSKELKTLAAENERLVMQLVKKGRSVGIELVLATQKGTTDAIPSPIRDQLTASVCFAVRTRQAAVAALGDAIGEFPAADPVQLQGPEYVGVCSMLVEGREGYQRVRVPYVPDELAAQVAQQTAHLNRAELLGIVEPRHLVVVS